jgi:hypothetical protein
MHAHSDVPAVVGPTSAALGLLAMSAAIPLPGAPWMVDKPMTDVPFPPGRGEEEGEGSAQRAEAGGGAALAYDDDALLRA